MATIWVATLLASACLPTAPGTRCLVSQCYDLKPFRNCSVDFATSGVAKTVLLGSCAERFAMKFLVMTLQPLPAETVWYRFSDFIQAINLRGADKPSLWALRQLSKVSSPDLVIVQPRAKAGCKGCPGTSGIWNPNAQSRLHNLRSLDAAYLAS